MKLFAKAVSGKRAIVVMPTQAQKLTGYLIGEVSPLAKKLRLPTVIQGSAEQLETVLISSGKKRIRTNMFIYGMRLNPEVIETLYSAKT